MRITLDCLDCPLLNLQHVCKHESFTDPYLPTTKITTHDLMDVLGTRQLNNLNGVMFYIEALVTSMPVCVQSKRCYFQLFGIYSEQQTLT